MRNKYKKKSGFTLVEVMLSIAIISFMLVAVYMVYDKVSNEAAAQDESKRLYRISGLISGTLGVVSDYSGLSNATFIQYLSGGSNGRAPALDANQIDKSNPTRIINAWGTDLTMGPATDPRGFILTENDIPTAGCVKIATKMADFANEIIINGITTKDWGKPFDVASVATGCGAKNVNKVDFVMYKSY
ncbi:prepilin-type N-terminal cleavage/methylation domain-containing protein [Burkholderia vietnamiensis]|nr:prepilin-type N-terminal cleavage/methylation domain-containing protein [Burkholderia vietnamiensis]